MSSTQATDIYAGPVPVVAPEARPYWSGCKAHELWLRACNTCTAWYFYPRDVCPHCGSRDVEWRQASGRATLYTFSVVHRAPSPAFAELVPYVTALVELEEGPRMPTSLVGIAPDPAQIKVGMALEVTFDDLTDELTLPRFRPA
jgi:uncharacterized protein